MRVVGFLGQLKGKSMAFTVGEFIAFLQERAPMDAELRIMAPEIGQEAEGISGIIIASDKPYVTIVPGEDEDEEWHSH